MSFKLVIVESPAKCLKIEKLLGPGYKCIASYGHIREIKGLDAIGEDFTTTFTPITSKNKQIANIRRMAEEASDVILAADDDREGEAIAWHVSEVLNLPVERTKRIIFHEITESALKKAITSARTLDMNRVHAQKARQVLDMLVGFRISPILWDKISYKTAT